MSEIANALAKAKERTGHTSAPFLVPGAQQAVIDPARAAAAAAAIQKARRTQRFWFILIAISLPATGYLVWSRLGPEPQPSADLSEAHTVTTQGQTFTSSDGTASSYSQTTTTASSSSTQAPAPDRPLPAPRPDLATRVSALSVAAVMPGDPPRIVIAGRIIRQGQALDADLTFTNISNGQILFTDIRGAVYSRRY